MEIRSESHLYGETIVREHFANEYAELLQLLRSSDVPLRAAGPYSVGRGAPPKRQNRKIGGTTKKILLPADMPALNIAFDRALRANGWRSQPYASDDVFASAGDKSRGDFERNGVFVEVEFGNTASLFRDLFKFQVANRERKGEVAVLITGTRMLMKFHDSGVATFEKMKSMLPYLAVSIQMPIWIVGIEPSGWDRIRHRYDEMLSVANHNDEDCHPFEAVFGSELPVESEPLDSSSPDNAGS
jgi:Restriction endonuclease BglII